MLTGIAFIGLGVALVATRTTGSLDGLDGAVAIVMGTLFLIGGIVFAISHKSSGDTRSNG